MQLWTIGKSGGQPAWRKHIQGMPENVFNNASFLDGIRKTIGKTHKTPFFIVFNENERLRLEKDGRNYIPLTDRSQGCGTKIFLGKILAGMEVPPSIGGEKRRYFVTEVGIHRPTNPLEQPLLLAIQFEFC